MAKPGPKPKVYTPKDIKQINKLAGIGCTDEMIANIMDISYTQFQKHKKDNELIARAIKKGRDEKLSQVMDTAFNLAAKGNPTMCIFILKTRAGWKEDGITEEDPVDVKKIREKLREVV